MGQVRLVSCRIQLHSITWPIQKDEKDVVHQLSAGDYVDENTDMIMKISHDAIYIEQNIRRNRKQESITIKLVK